MRDRYVRLNLWAPLLVLHMTQLAAEGLFTRHVCARAHMCARVRAGYSVTQGLSVGHILFLTIRPHPSDKEREKEAGPVQMNYSNHLVDSEKEGRGGKKVGHKNKPLGTRSVTLTVQYDHCLCNSG